MEVFRRGPDSDWQVVVLLPLLSPITDQLPSCPKKTPTAITAPGRRPRLPDSQHLRTDQSVQALKHQLLSRLSQNFRPEIVYVLLVGKFDQIRSIANYYFEESFIESESESLDQ